MLWGIVWGAALAAALAGCGSSAHSNSNAPATASAACTQLHTANAMRAARCNGGAAADWLANLDSQEDCSTYDGYVEQHLVQYRPQGFAACLAEYDKPCDQAVSACTYEILKGQVADGRPCKDSEVCGTTSGCLQPESAGTCGTVCGRLAVENEVCGFYCGSATPCLAFPFCAFDFACVNNVCVKTKGIGESCGPADPTPCSALLACSADPADPQSTGTCQARTAGGACHADVNCPADQFCAHGACAARRLLGEACADTPSSCVPWTVCDAASGRCVAAGKPGQPCAAPYASSPDAGFCAVGTCFDTTCVANASPGGSCAMALCAAGNSCDGTTLTCVACPP